MLSQLKFALIPLVLVAGPAQSGILMEGADTCAAFSGSKIQGQGDQLSQSGTNPSVWAGLRVPCQLGRASQKKSTPKPPQRSSSCELLWTGKITCNGEEIQTGEADHSTETSSRGWTARYPGPIEPEDGWTAQAPAPIKPASDWVARYTARSAAPIQPPAVKKTTDGWVAKVPQTPDNWTARFPGPVKPFDEWVARYPASTGVKRPQHLPITASTGVKRPQHLPISVRIRFPWPAASELLASQTRDGWVAHVPSSSTGWVARYPGATQPNRSAASELLASETHDGWVAHVPSSCEGWSARYPGADRGVPRNHGGGELLASQTRDGWVAHVPSSFRGWVARYPGAQPNRSAASELLASETRDGWVAHVPSSCEGWSATYPGSSHGSAASEVLALETHDGWVAHIPQALKWSDGQCSFRLWQGRRVCDSSSKCGTAWMGEQVPCETAGRGHCGFSVWSGHKQCEVEYDSSVQLLDGRALGLTGHRACHMSWSGRSELCSAEDAAQTSPPPPSEPSEGTAAEKDLPQQGSKCPLIWAGTRGCSTEGCHVLWSGKQMPCGATSHAAAPDSAAAAPTQRPIMRCQVLQGGSIACFTESSTPTPAEGSPASEPSAWAGSRVCRMPGVQGCATVWEGTAIEQRLLPEPSSEPMYYRTWSGVERCSVSQEQTALSMNGAARMQTRHRSCATLWSGSESYGESAEEDVRVSESADGVSDGHSVACPVHWNAEHVCDESFGGKCGIAWTGEQVCIAKKCHYSMWSGHKQCETEYDSSIPLLDGRARGVSGHVACQTTWSGTSQCNAPPDISNSLTASLTDGGRDLTNVEQAVFHEGNTPIDLGFDLEFSSWSAHNHPPTPTAAPAPTPVRAGMLEDSIWLSSSTPRARPEVGPWESATKFPASWSDVAARFTPSRSWSEVVTRFFSL